jgi:hypothetical protein
MSVKYCNASCQHKHWPMHKKDCKLRVAELRDEALFKDPPPKEECPICFLPMPGKIMSCATFPPATISSAPIYDFAIANEALKDHVMEEYHPCCGKSICKGCAYSSYISGNIKCPFCNCDRSIKTVEDQVEEIMKRAEANDAASIFLLANYYHQGIGGLQHDHTKSMELYARAGQLGFSKAHSHLGSIYHKGGDMKKAKFHFAAAAMAGDEVARYNLGSLETHSGNMEQAVKHWIIAASAGSFDAMHSLIICVENGHASKESINLT